MESPLTSSEHECRFAETLAAYADRTRRSKANRHDFGRHLADSRASVNFRMPTKEVTYPIVGARAKGGRIWDVDGNVYVDLAMGFGVQLFGHDAPFVRDAIDAQLSNGLYLGPQAPLAGTVAAKLVALTGVERVSFCNTGTEAVMMALRLARAATGRDGVAMFKWSYHGNYDPTLARPRPGKDGAKTIPLAAGIPAPSVETTLMLDYGEQSALEALEGHGDRLAAVVVEPVQSLRPGIQPREFLHSLRDWCTARGVALIFDEILLGFRIHQRGAQAHFEVQADIVTYGKILGGGLPIGAVAGKARFLDAIDGGAWQFGDDSAPSGTRTFFAGTFNKNPLGMAVALAVLTRLDEEGPSLQEHLNARTAAFVNELNEHFEARQIPLSIDRFGSLFRFAGRGSMDPFYYALANNGVYLWEGRSCFLSTAHTDDDLAHARDAIRDAARAIKI